MEIILLSIIIVLQIVVLIFCVQGKSNPAEVSEQPSYTHIPVLDEEAVANLNIRPSEEHEILELRDGQWHHHSWRHGSHPDINVYCKHPRFNVRQPDGSLMREEIPNVD